jgi:hypothetical protein
MASRGNARPWLGRALLIGAGYAIIGVVFGAFGSSFVSARSWRLAAWTISGAIYAAHIGYERSRLGASRPATAFHAAVAAGTGGFGLAVAATVHSLLSASPDRRLRLFTLALVVWPIVTAVPAYLVALVASTVLSPMKRR